MLFDRSLSAVKLTVDTCYWQGYGDKEYSCILLVEMF